MKMNQTEKSVAMYYILNRINHANYGMLSGGYNLPGVSMRDQMEFSENGWSIDKNMRFILKDDEPVYKIISKYGKNGKMLKPSLEYIG